MTARAEFCPGKVTLLGTYSEQKGAASQASAAMTSSSKWGFKGPSP